MERGEGIPCVFTVFIYLPVFICVYSQYGSTILNTYNIIHMVGDSTQHSKHHSM